ncbi:MAG: UDP-N-acetylmuramoyl-L-alanyl-D-glutamate--2,6-diaminopimelate ligase, partial [Gemmatimonadetes bacterium]|nr:UDP-N-acetylmuramoyl-L-alanyl-D-glutamate--2,6-diaminopimelate ligase [Gemmatimonadota bacterium]NIS31740.1 UDP-N-acetylmuramoyl-L-alanyl-D-glutamate--2,6-diaminopimelate ligase [Actinomycetota bacterium]NIU66840.1 UDP-N-acetylmuramoyl-L-alanyl-D-glutamate--2,6-diaminopimelate ligase [Actinomycetota bacterium]NIW28640.1 UDP-N-acetylmuramoyl-L-alanyl-D-glutamate--2,6-diaminopimelate ligase [Actinomycetota bacterium]NIX21102.1 UDP-N-acetylmuramoyl-L-alanyl-D-glutamate--2,6-diaminopimelate liga
VSGITDDSRRLGPGELFCAVPGHRHDGHRFLDQAVRAGAAAALVESPRADLDVPQLRVTDARRATAIAAQAVYGDPARDLRLIGVTGTNGKTTTVH